MKIYLWKKNNYYIQHDLDASSSASQNWKQKTKTKTTATTKPLKEQGKRQEKKQEVFGIWVTHILFQLIYIIGLLNLFVKRICCKSTVIIIVLHILLRHFHSERSISIMIAWFCFTREILKANFVILFLVK